MLTRFEHLGLVDLLCEVQKHPNMDVYLKVSDISSKIDELTKGDEVIDVEQPSNTILDPD